MKTGVLIFLFIFAVPSSQLDKECVQQYLVCSVPIVNNWQNLKNCSLIVPYVKCITTVSRKCDTNISPILENIEGLLEDICSPDVAKKEEWVNAGYCIANNSNSFKSCIKNLEEDSEDSCNASKAIMDCVSSTVHQKCGSFAGNVIDKLLSPMQILATLCIEETKAGISEDAQCLIKKDKTLDSCKLEGVFNTVGDVCSSVDRLIQCLVRKADEACGAAAKQLLEYYLWDLAFLMKLCNNFTVIQQTVIPECQKEVLKCNVNLFNVREAQCSDVSNYVGCLADASGKCADVLHPLYSIVLGKYKTKFPEYCDKDSSFNQNYQKGAECMEENSVKVVDTCFPKLKKDFGDLSVAESVRNLRAYVNILKCISSEFGTTCSTEAEHASNDIFLPMVDSLDESCRMLTGERCNSACGLKVALWLFIASLAYLLTRRHE